MSDKKISPPAEHKAEAVARRVVRGLTGAIPVVGSMATEAVDGLMPDAAATDRRRWEGDVTEGVNDLGGRVDEIDHRTRERKETISALPAQILAHMIRSCPDGLALRFTPLADLAKEFPDESERAVKDAMADLESHHLVERFRSLNGPGQFRLTHFAYEQIDPQLMGWDTEQDAKELMRIVGGTTEGVRASDLEERTGWSKRRLNPALRIVLSYVADGRISKQSQADYAAAFFIPNDAERAQMRRMGRS